MLPKIAGPYPPARGRSRRQHVAEPFLLERTQRTVAGSYARENCDVETGRLIAQLEHENTRMFTEIRDFRSQARAATGRQVFMKGILAYIAIAGLIGTGSWLRYSARGQHAWAGASNIVWAVGYATGLTHTEPPPMPAGQPSASPDNRSAP